MKRRFVIFGILGAAIVLICVTYFVVKPSSVRGNFPARFPEDEKRQIASVIQRDRYHRSFRYLRGGEFGVTWRWLRKSQKQRVWAVGNQPDGGIWVHVGIDDKSQPDGYSLTCRYIMKKEDGKWKIVGSDI